MHAYQPLEHRTFNNLRVQAFKHALLDFSGGPVLLDPEFARFRHRKFNVACDVFDGDASFEKHLAGDWIYLGPKYHHFGHIMAEMVHRIIPSQLFFPGAHKYLIVTTFDDPCGPGFESLCPSYREVLEFCQVDLGSVFILNENTIVEQLSICEQGSNLGGYATPWYLDVLQEFSEARLNELYGAAPSPARVYVSKSKIPHGGTILGESYIEQILSHEGFFIFHPEEAPLSAQMEVYRKAKEIVFSEGSACHGTELLGKEMLGRTFVLVRRMEMRPDLVGILGARSREFEMFVNTFFLGTVAVHAQTRRPHTEFGVSLVDIDRLVAFFRDHGLARLDAIDVNRYLDAAREDLKAYFAYHMHSDLADVDPWRVGEVRLEFEKNRERLLGSPHPSRSGAAGLAASDDPEAIGKHAWAAHAGKRWMEAAYRWEAFRERFPDSAEGFALGSVVLIELGRFYEADALLLLAIERFPSHTEIHGNYALVAHCRRDWKEAVTRWDVFRTKFPECMAGYSLGATALCELGRYVDADELLEKGLQQHPNDEELLEKRAWVAQLDGNEPEALRRWEAVRDLYPSNRAAQAYG